MERDIERRTRVTHGENKMSRLSLTSATPDRVNWLTSLYDVDRKSFGKLWILAQYYKYPLKITIQQARDSLFEYFKNTNDTGTSFYPPTMGQILGKMRELKTEWFITIWDYAASQSGNDDIFKFAATASIEELLYGDGFYEGIFSDKPIRLRTSDKVAIIETVETGFANGGIDLHLGLVGRYEQAWQDAEHLANIEF